jgi:nicotinamide-nucleotide amidase
VNAPCDDAALYALAEQVKDLLLAANKKVLVAESCTGGWIAKALTDVPGSSAVFDLGLVTYANEAKTRHLGVPAALLEQYGAVSEQVVGAMLDGLLALAPGDFAIATSGVAGPGGGSEEKPVGLVWIGLAGAQPSERLRETGESFRSIEKRQYQGDREAIRRQTVAFALSQLIDRL